MTDNMNMRRTLLSGLVLAAFILSSGSIVAQSKYIQAVDEYVPAPGQFTNTMPKADESDTPATMAQKCTEYLANNNRQMISLGAYGGYVTFHFDHPIVNVTGQMDLLIEGNALAGGSEAGIVMVSQDINANGLPDDPWYELSGSADVDSIGKVVYGYTITYSRQGDLQDVAWTDSQNGSGSIPRNGFHTQEYFPLWLGSELSFKGTLLPTNALNRKPKGNDWLLSSLRYGYVDNVPNADSIGNSFNLDWAVEPVSRQPVSLTHADFIRVYTALNQVCGWLGETSTEVIGAEDLHLEASLEFASGIKEAVLTVKGQYFDLQGRPVANPSRGLYMINGKKVFINP